MVSDDGGLLPCLFRGPLGMMESVVSGSGRRQWFFYLGGWYREWEEKASRGPWSSSYVHFMSRLQTDQNLCIYVLYYLFYII